MINNLILALSSILAGGCFCDYLVKKINNDFTLSSDNTQYVLKADRLKALMLLVLGIMVTFIALALIDNISEKQSYQYLKALMIVISALFFSSIWKKRVATSN